MSLTILVKCLSCQWGEMLRFVHKEVVGFRQALQRIIDRYGAYISHLTALSVDSSVNNADKAKLKGYLSKWQQGKMLIGCAMYVDALKPPSLLSKALQEDSVDIVLCLQNILHAKKKGCIYSLDWTTGLDYWTGLLDSLFPMATIAEADYMQVASYSDYRCG